jgi:hypothetical protein
MPEAVPPPGTPTEVPPDVEPPVAPPEVVPVTPVLDVVFAPEPEPTPTFDALPPGVSALLPGPTPVVELLEPEVLAPEVLPETERSVVLGRAAPAPVSVVVDVLVAPPVWVKA